MQEKQGAKLRCSDCQKLFIKTMTYLLHIVFARYLAKGTGSQIFFPLWYYQATTYF